MAEEAEAVVGPVAGGLVVREVAAAGAAPGPVARAGQEAAGWALAWAALGLVEVSAPVPAWEPVQAQVARGQASAPARVWAV